MELALQNAPSAIVTWNDPVGVVDQQSQTSERTRRVASTASCSGVVVIASNGAVWAASGLAE